MRSVDRRQFMKGAAALGGAFALGSRVPSWADEGPPGGSGSSLIPGTEPLADSILNSAAASCPIETIVVITMENRSFDHYFGHLGTNERYLENGRSKYGSGFTVDGSIDETYLLPDGTPTSTFHLPGWDQSLNPYRGCGGHPDPGHGWASGRAQRDHGFVADGTGNDEFALGYFLGEDLPCYSQLVQQGTIFDRYFCSLLASTYPNREYLHSAQSGGRITNNLPIAELGFKTETIWDRLNQARVPAALYGVDLPTTVLWGAKQLVNTRPIAALFADAAVGILPRVTFVDPGFLSGMRTDDHPHGDMRMGQKFVASIISTLQASPQWEKMAIFVTYDEWGGFFDHVTPAIFADDRASTDDLQNFGQAGFRLPVSMVSPYARPGFVDHRTYDHASILRFIEWRYLGAPAEGPGGSGWWLTARDRNANNIGASLSAQRQTEAMIDANAVPLIISTPCKGQILQDVPGIEIVEDDVLLPVLDAVGIDLEKVNVELTIEPSAFELARDLGVFESRGYDTEPSLTLLELLDP